MAVMSLNILLPEADFRLPEKASMIFFMNFAMHHTICQKKNLLFCHVVHIPNSFILMYSAIIQF